MRSEQEINDLLQTLTEDLAAFDPDQAGVAAQALAWVLGDPMSPLELL